MTKQHFSFVSVIIATYNRASILPRAIQSVLNQTHNNFELLIIDDGSIDNTEDVVHSFKDSRIRSHKHKHNLGQNAALNTGLRLAEGSYIAFLDSDDEWLPENLEKQLARFEKDNTLGCVYAHAGKRLENNNLEVLRKFHIEGDIYKEALTQGYVSCMITLMVKKECFHRVGLFDTEFSVCQDDDICLRLARYYRFGLNPEILAIVHNDGGSQVTGNPKAYADGWWRLFTKHEAEILRECGNGTLALHYTKCAWLYIKASAMKEAKIALIKAERIDNSIRSWDLKIATRIAPPIVALLLRIYEKACRAKRIARRFSNVG